jgi:uncharacterized membrane protein YkvA (DUF1232 family)
MRALSRFERGPGRQHFVSRGKESGVRPVCPKALRDWARAIKRDVHALFLASRDPRVPWHAKATAVCVAAYALSPVDLIPDFVPVLGYLDDVIIVPLGILLAVRLIPGQLMSEHRAAAALAESRPATSAGAIVIVLVWIAAALLTAWLAWRNFFGLYGLQAAPSA